MIPLDQCVCVCVCVQLCLTLCDPVGCSLPGSPVHGVFQVRILEWVAISYSRGLSPFRDWTCISCVSYIAGCVLYQLSHQGSSLWPRQLLKLCCTMNMKSFSVQASCGFWKWQATYMHLKALKATKKTGRIWLGLPQMLSPFIEAEALLGLWLFISIRVWKHSCHKIGLVTV